MKKIVLAFIVCLTLVNAEFGLDNLYRELKNKGTNYVSKKAKSYYKTLSEEQSVSSPRKEGSGLLVGTNGLDMKEHLSQLPPSSINRSIFNGKKCDQIVKRNLPVAQTDVTICYNYGLKSATYVDYTLTKAMIEAPSIDERPRFYEDTSLPQRYRVSYSNYTRSKKDRGHIANDADFDYAQADLEAVYAMSNIIPQDPVVNRKIWIKAEKYERYMAMKLGYVTVLNGIVFDKNPKRIKGGMAIPVGFWKKIENKSKDFKRCFYFDNFFRGSLNSDKLRNHEVNCNRLR